MKNKLYGTLLMMTLAGVTIMACGKKQQAVDGTATDSDSFVVARRASVADSIASQTKQKEVVEIGRLRSFSFENIYVTPEGVGPLKPGMQYDWSDLIPTGEDWKAGSPFKEELEQCKMSGHTFYNRVEIVYTGLTSHDPYLCFYNGTELMAATELAYQDFQLGSIYIYSPKLKLKNGIHTGMTAAELASRYHARVNLSNGPECEDIWFDIPGISSSIQFEASYDAYSKVAGLDAGDERTVPLKLEQVKNCKLAVIVVSPAFN